MPLASKCRGCAGWIAPTTCRDCWAVFGSRWAGSWWSGIWWCGLPWPCASGAPPGVPGCAGRAGRAFPVVQFAGVDAVAGHGRRLRHFSARAPGKGAGPCVAGRIAGRAEHRFVLWPAGLVLDPCPACLRAYFAARAGTGVPAGPAFSSTSIGHPLRPKSGMTQEQTEILIIGAGPAGAVAAGLLRKQGRQVLSLEREQFPRFSIGESLLPQSMEYIEAAGMLQAVVEAGFQYKNGAAFACGEQHTEFDFRDKYSPGWGTTYQVQRGRFDQVLATQAARLGAQVRFRHQVLDVDVARQRPSVQVRDQDGHTYGVAADFLLDASGFGRVLPRLLGLEYPSTFPPRSAIFTHVQDNIPVGAHFDRQKILITVHPQHGDVWYWTIPFSDGRCSQGVVARTEFLAQYPGSDMDRLQALVGQAPGLRSLLARSAWDTPARCITGYSANVTSLWGKGFALLGNAGEFLDPVFSSGVTIAFKSASL